MNHELDEIGDARKRFEGAAPIDRRGDLARLESGRIEEVEGVADADADGEGRDVAQLPGKLRWKTDEVVFADRDDFHGVRVFEVGGVRVGIGGQELLGGF